MPKSPSGGAPRPNGSPATGGRTCGPPFRAVRAANRKADDRQVTKPADWRRSSPNPFSPRSKAWSERRDACAADGEFAMNLLKEIENEQMAKLVAGKDNPDFQPGDTLIVNVKIVEGERSRVQAYEGVCIGRAGSGINENFTVRKISYGEGVERVFPLYSPMIDSIEVVRRGKVRRAKLYYLRGRRGKSARIIERQDSGVGAEEMGAEEQGTK